MAGPSLFASHPEVPSPAGPGTATKEPTAVPPTSPTAVGTPAPASDPGPGTALDIGAISDPDQVRAAADWLRWGRCRGLAPEALLLAALAGTASRPGDHCGRSLPACRSELYACLRLTHDLPWTRRGLEPLAAAWPAWRALRSHWDEMAATLAAEVGPSWPEIDRGRTGWWPDTPRTVELLRRVLAQGGISI